MMLKLSSTVLPGPDRTALPPNNSLTAARQTHHLHGVPIFTQNLATLTGSHEVVCGGKLRPSQTRKYHECIHRTLGVPVGIQSW